MMLGKETSRLKGLYLFWNQVDKRETSGLYEKYGQVVADMGPLNIVNINMKISFWMAYIRTEALTGAYPWTTQTVLSR